MVVFEFGRAAVAKGAVQPGAAYQAMYSIVTRQAAGPGGHASAGPGRRLGEKVATIVADQGRAVYRKQLRPVIEGGAEVMGSWICG